MSEARLSRRSLIGSAAAAAALFGAPSLSAQPAQRQLARVILDNDFSGDPDGLVQLAHHLLCPAVEIPLIVGSHLPVKFGGPRSASDAAAKALALLKRMNLARDHTPIAGAELPIASRAAWR